MYHTNVIKQGFNISQFTYNNQIYDRIYQHEIELATEFENTKGMLKIPDSTKMSVRCCSQYHIISPIREMLTKKQLVVTTLGE